MLCFAIFGFSSNLTWMVRKKYPIISISNVFVKPNEQCRACSYIVMARKRTFQGTKRTINCRLFVFLFLSRYIIPTIFVYLQYKNNFTLSKWSMEAYNALEKQLLYMYTMSLRSFCGMHDMALFFWWHAIRRTHSAQLWISFFWQIAYMEKLYYKGSD